MRTKRWWAHLSLSLALWGLFAPHRALALERGDLPGAYNCVHKDWRDTLYLSSDGTYRRGSGDAGHWTWDGQKLVLKWDHWGPETLFPTGNGEFKAHGYRFEIHRTTQPVPGRYLGVHRDWRGPVFFTPDGRFHRDNGDPGSWSFDGKVLTIKWDHWGTESLDLTGPGAFKARVDPLTLTREGDLPSVARVDPALVGTYRGVHKDWRDTVTLGADGRFARGSGDPGSWSWDGQKLVLKWDHWGPETLYPQGPGAFAAKGYTFELRKIETPQQLQPTPQVPAVPDPGEPEVAPQPKQPVAAAVEPISDDELERMVKAITHAGAPHARLTTLKAAAQGKHFTAAQVGTLLEAFHFSADKLDALKLVHASIVDPGNSFTLLEKFPYSVDKDRAQRILAR